MLKKKIKNLDNGNVFHLINQERKIDKIILPLAAVYTSFLIWAVMFNFGLFMRVIFVTFVILSIYFFTCRVLDLYDRYKDKNS